MVALKGVNQNFLQSPQWAMNCLQRVHSSVQIMSNTLGAQHVQHVMWYKGTAHLLSLTDLNDIYFSCILLVETINQWRRGGNLSTWRKPLATSFRKCHILKPENSNPNWGWTHILALVAGQESRCVNHYTTHRPSRWQHMNLSWPIYPSEIYCMLLGQ